MMRWYVLHTLSGQEQRTKELIEERVSLNEMESLVKEIIVPTQSVQEIRSGKKKVTTRKFYPGYILLNMDITNDSWQLVRRTQGVIGFLGGEHPAALTTAEVKEMFEQIESAKEKIAPRVSFVVGDKVKVNDGPFVNFMGQVEEVDEDRGKLGVSVSVFGRTTPVELEYWQVEKA